MTSQSPVGFEEFWNDIDKDLASYPIAPEIEHIPMRSTEAVDLYGVRLTSVGPYRLFAYLSIQKDQVHFQRSTMFRKTAVFMKLFLREPLPEFVSDI